MAVHARVGAGVRVVAAPWGRVGGVWRRGDRMFVKQGGAWRLVWPAPASVSVAATPVRWDRIDLSWSQGPGVVVDVYELVRGGKVLASGVVSFSDTGLDPGTAYTYEVRGYRDGNIAARAVVVVQTPALSVAPMTATPVSTSRIDLAWSNPGGLTSVRLRDSAGGSQTLAAGATSGTKTGLAANTSYNFAVDGVRESQVWADLGLVSAKTLAPQFESRVWSGDAHVSASYDGDGKNRGVAEMYGGRYSSNQGRQSSVAMFGFPADVRDTGGCVSIQKIEMQLYTRHHYYGSGGKVRVAPHRWYYPGGFPTDIPGGYYPTFGEWSADRGKFVGGGTTEATGWIDITNLVPSGWGHTMAEEIRTQGCWGLAIWAPDDTYTYYGYWDGAGQQYRPRLRIEYTVRTG